MTRREDDTPLSKEEIELAKKGEALIAAAVSETEAPQSLRESIERDRVRVPPPKVPFWRRHTRALAGAGAALVVAIALVVVLQAGSGSDGGSAPTLAALETAARLEATGPAPAKAGGDPPVLARSVGAIQFPDWEEKFEWRETGSRSSEVGGRSVETVYYRNPKGADLAYAIADGPPLAATPPGRKVVHEGKTYHVANTPQRTIVTWNQQGHTCTFVASSAVPDLNLVELAASRNV
jgi:hypothetical protein